MVLNTLALSLTDLVDRCLLEVLNDGVARPPDAPARLAPVHTYGACCALAGAIAATSSLLARANGLQRRLRRRTDVFAPVNVGRAIRILLTACQTNPQPGATHVTLNFAMDNVGILIFADFMISN